MCLWPYIEQGAVCKMCQYKKTILGLQKTMRREQRACRSIIAPINTQGKWTANQYPCIRGKLSGELRERGFPCFAPIRMHQRRRSWISRPAVEQTKSASKIIDGTSHTNLCRRLLCLRGIGDWDQRGLIVNNTPGGCSFVDKEHPQCRHRLSPICQNSPMYPAPCVYTDPPSGYN